MTGDGGGANCWRIGVRRPARTDSLDLIRERSRYADAGFRRGDRGVGAVDGQTRLKPHGSLARVEAPVVDYADALKRDDVVIGKFVGRFWNTVLFQIGGACYRDTADLR